MSAAERVGGNGTGEGATYVSRLHIAEKMMGASNVNNPRRGGVAGWIGFY
jgi:hypothetical protein